MAAKEASRWDWATAAELQGSLGKEAGKDLICLVRSWRGKLLLPGTSSKDESMPERVIWEKVQPTGVPQRTQPE